MSLTLQSNQRKTSHSYSLFSTVKEDLVLRRINVIRFLGIGNQTNELNIEQYPLFHDKQVRQRLTLSLGM